MIRLDAHQHFWHFDPVRDAWITESMAVLRRDYLPDDLAPELSTRAIDGTIAVQADQSERETAFLLELAEEHPTVRGVVGWVDLRSDDLRRMLEHFTTFPGFRGVRHIAQAEPDDFLEREDVVRGIAQLADFGLTYDILVYERQLPAALALVARLPDQPFVIDHIAKPRIADGVLHPWAEHMRELAQHPNVWCKVSGLVTEADWRAWTPDDLRPYLDVVFDAFGADKLMFGSDWPVCLLAGSYARVLGVVEEYAAQLREAERDALFGGTAAGFYGIAL